MRQPAPWVDDDNAALLTDLYELTMLQAYFHEGLFEPAVFSLHVRRLPPRRNYLLACGLDDALRYLERLRFPPDAIDYLHGRGGFPDDFLDWLSALRFRGDAWAVAEGTPVFADEPLLEIRASLPEAQLAETFVMNQMHLATVVASKGARVVHAAAGRDIVDFGLRRVHGADAGLKAARALYIAGIAATSNVLAGRVYGIPIAGTMAHSYIQAHRHELDAFRAFAELYPATVLLVDTYDTLEGVRKVIELARELGDAFRVRAVRLDSGDLAELAIEARRMLDDAGLSGVGIFASGSLDEDRVAQLLERGAPIQGFGVGTRMGVSSDAPYLDIAYKLVEFAGRGRLKLSPGKHVLPGRKQVFRREESGQAVGDVIAVAGEQLEGRPLLEQVLRNGERLEAGRVSLEASRQRAADELSRLPPPVLGLADAEPPYPVELSAALSAETERVTARVERNNE